MGTLKRNLPLAYVIFAPLAWFAALFAALGGHLEAVKFAVYVPYAFAIVVIALCSIVLVRRSEDGKASVLLIAFTYESCFFSMALSAVVSLLVLRTFSPELLDPARNADAFAVWAQALSYAMIAGSAAGSVLTAMVFWHGIRFGGLYDEVDYLPFGLSRRK